jgi:hypothetical protein
MGGVQFLPDFDLGDPILWCPAGQRDAAFDTNGSRVTSRLPARDPDHPTIYRRGEMAEVEPTVSGWGCPSTIFLTNWIIAMLHQRERIQLVQPVKAWRRNLIDQGVHE